MKKTLQRSVLTNEIYELLKEQILSYQLQPGTKINIDQLARELNVSNIPIREALTRLAAEGLVRMQPFKGMYVAEISLEELDEIFELRTYLECLAVRKAAPAIPEEEIIRLGREINTIYPEITSEPRDELNILVRMNEGVHGLILRFCGNRALQDLLKLYRERIERYYSFVHQDLGVSILEAEWQEHKAIWEQLAGRNIQAAEEAMHAHLNSSHQRTRELFVRGSTL